MQASTPKQRIAAECARHGTRALVAACVALLEARPGDVSDDMITVLGGESARYVLDGDAGGKAGYWPRVWGARGLLYRWDAAATSAVIGGTHDEAWRVREMAAKARELHHDASEKCFIASSVNFPVRHEPSVTVASA